MSHAEAFAVVDPKGKLLVDAVRSTEGESKAAAIRLQKTPGLSWKTLEQAGHRVVRVSVTVQTAGQRPKPPPAAQEPRPGVPESRADQKPIRPGRGDAMERPESTPERARCRRGKTESAKTRAADPSSPRRHLSREWSLRGG
jgi:hypothetical protein